jgi:glycosyltransferase involved in cell wall biosynthesis
MPSLALVMIARDEEACIGRCLMTAAPFVDEMIVVDTGSADRTAAIAVECGATVHRMAWADDFAAARNFALKWSFCDWNLVLDADEWVVGGGETLRDMLGEPFLGLIRIRNHIDVGASQETSFVWLPRLLPRGTRYEGRIHEHPVSTLPARRTELRIDHSGYQAHALARKKGRNERLLLAALADNPDDVYLLYQLAREYQVAGNFGASACHFRLALAKSIGREHFRHSLVVRAIYTFKMAGMFDEAVKLVDGEIDNWAQSPDFFFTVGDLYLELAVCNPELAAGQLLPVVEFCWKKCLEIGERSDLDGAVRGRGGHMAAHNLATFYRTLGDHRNAARYAALEAELRAA